jgi:hypothetical protein
LLFAGGFLLRQFAAAAYYFENTICCFCFIFVRKSEIIYKNRAMEKFYKFKEIAMLNTFGIQTITECSELNDWLQTNDSVDDYDNQTLDKALKRYAALGKGWNEEELKMHFISDIFKVADPNIPNVCKTFFERPLEGVVNNYLMHVVTDCMIASPRLGGDPDKPYFFLQEFKQAQNYGKTDRSGGRPQGQMLAAMLLAQEQNKDGKHLYGCYVIEKNWHFTTLLGLDYCVSRQYDSTQKHDLLQIVFILRKLKELIAGRTVLNR